MNTISPRFGQVKLFQQYPPSSMQDAQRWLKDDSLILQLEEKGVDVFLSGGHAGSGDDLGSHKVEFEHNTRGSLREYWGEGLDIDFAQLKQVSQELLSQLK